MPESQPLASGERLRVWEAWHWTPGGAPGSSHNASLARSPVPGHGDGGKQAEGEDVTGNGSSAPSSAASSRLSSSTHTHHVFWEPLPARPPAPIQCPRNQAQAGGTVDVPGSWGWRSQARTCRSWAQDNAPSVREGSQWPWPAYLWTRLPR